MRPLTITSRIEAAVPRPVDRRTEPLAKTKPAPVAKAGRGHAGIETPDAAAPPRARTAGKDSGSPRAPARTPAGSVPRFGPPHWRRVIYRLLDVALIASMPAAIAASLLALLLG